MGTFSSIEEARGFFAGDKFAACNGMSIDELGDSFAVCSMTVGDDHRNALGNVMGGVTFTLADFAFSVLVNHIHMPTVAQQVSINYLAPPKSNTLIARAELKKSGKNSCVANVFVTDGSGRDVAQFVGTGFKLDGNAGGARG